MKTTFPRLFANFVLLGVLIFAFRCEKDDDSPLLPPSILISDSVYSDKTFHIDDTLSNVLNISINLPKKNRVLKTEFYVDGNKLAEDAEAPFSFYWNTLKEEDGQHHFSAVLTNKNGSTENLNREFFTSNTLLRVEIGNIIRGKFYLILSDEKGKILATEKLSIGLEKDIKPTQPFYSDKFNFTTARIEENFRSIATTVNYKKGSPFKYQEVFSPTRDPLLLRITGHPDVSSAYVCAGSGDAINNPKEFSFKHLTYDQGGKLYVEVNKNGKQYYDLIEITGNEMDVDLNLITKDFTPVTFETMPGATHSVLKVGYVINGDSENGYWLSSRDLGVSITGPINTDYPSAGFDFFFTSFSSSIGNRTYSYSTRGDFPKKLIYINAEAVISNQSPGNFSAKLSGTSDFYFLNYNATSENGTTYWGISVPSSQEHFMLPEIGDVVGIPDLQHGQFNLNSITLEDALAVSGVGYLPFPQRKNDYEAASLTVFTNNPGLRKIAVADHKKALDRFKEHSH